MRVICNDEIVREFIPAEIPKTKFVYQPKPAYCHHCKEEFTRQSSQEQKPIWKAHICKTGPKKGK